MKYLKTYKLFENKSDVLILNSTNDFQYLNDSITELHVRFNIKEWPKLPNKLEYLSCSLNYKIRKLPEELPNTLTRLVCSNNVITKLPKLPKKLKWLICSSNLITEIPELPESLEVLECFDNKINKLPKLPKFLNELRCSNNELTEIPELPIYLTDLFIYGNPLEKLPKGITKEFLDKQTKHWIEENTIKWLINEPNDYNLLKDYLTDTQRKSFEENGPETFKNMNQFGMFGLKNKN